jgi:hypothetical protein
MANNGIGSLNDLRKKITLTHESISTSYHEAGHVIYGLIKGWKIEAVTIFELKKTKRINGFTHYSDPPNLPKSRDSEIFEHFIVSEIGLKYAGLVAEKCHFKKMSGSDKFPLFLRDGSSDDTLSAAALIKTYNLAPPGRKRYSYKKKLIRETQVLIEENWDAVTAVAHHLFKKKRLTFEDLRKILTKSGINKKYWKTQFANITYIYENSGGLDEKELKIILLP